MFGEKGCLQIYTGDGKGKTTAALGLALRACGHGARVVIIQFMKGWSFYGELEAAKHLPQMTIIQTGRPDYVHKGQETDEDFAEARRGMRLAREYMEGGCDMLILDEINVALDFGLIRIEEAIDLVNMRPEGMELVLTGRAAHERLLAAADLITEMREMKHPYQNGICSRRAVEY